MWTEYCGSGCLRWDGWQNVIVIVKPETVLAWHRRCFRLFWIFEEPTPPGPSVPLDVHESHLLPAWMDHIWCQSSFLAGTGRADGAVWLHFPSSILNRDAGRHARQDAIVGSLMVQAPLGFGVWR